MLTRQERTMLATLLLLAAGAMAWLLFVRWQSGPNAGLPDSFESDPLVVADEQTPAHKEPAAINDQEQSTMIVHVAGAVMTPGVYELSGGARVVDALAAAGGPLDDAALDALNLAAPVVDGSRIFVPTSEQAGSAQWGAAQAEAAAAGGPMPYRVNINSAGVAELQTLPGIGPVLAARIIDFRQRNGPFLSFDELLAVSGIGPRVLEQIQPYLVLP